MTAREVTSLPSDMQTVEQICRRVYNGSLSVRGGAEAIEQLVKKQSEATPSGSAHIEGAERERIAIAEAIGQT
jgi:hypothetical protein